MKFKVLENLNNKKTIIAIILVFVLIFLFIMYCYRSFNYSGYCQSECCQKMTNEHYTNDNQNNDDQNNGNQNNDNQNNGYQNNGDQQTNIESKLPDAEIILYYALWCHHSRTFLPEWEKFVSKAEAELPNISVSKIRCEGGDQATCFQKGIEGFPSVIAYKKDGTEITYNGERRAEKLLEFAKNI